MKSFFILSLVASLCWWNEARAEVIPGSQVTVADWVLAGMSGTANLPLRDSCFLQERHHHDLYRL